MEALDCAVADMERARAAFDAAAVRVSNELERLARRVTEANFALSSEREHVARAEGKRRRRSGGARAQPEAAAQAAGEHSPDAQAEWR